MPPPARRRFEQVLKGNSMFRSTTLACVGALAVCGLVWGGTKANSRPEVRTQNEVTPAVDATRETADAFVTAIAGELSRRTQPAAEDSPKVAATVAPIRAIPRDGSVENALSYAGPGVMRFTPSDGSLIFGRNDNLMSPWVGFDLSEDERLGDNLDAGVLVELEGTLDIRFDPSSRVLHVHAVSDENSVFEHDFDLSPKLRRDGVEASASYIVSFFARMRGEETAAVPFVRIEDPGDASTMAACSCSASQCSCSVSCGGGETANCTCREVSRCNCICLLQ